MKIPFSLQVSLGKTNDLLAADYDADKLPAGCHSTKGLGKTAPDHQDNFTMYVGESYALDTYLQKIYRNM